MRDRSMATTPRLLLFLPLVVALCSCGRKLPQEKKSLDRLEAMLKDDDPKVQAQGAYGLSLDRDKSRAAIPALIDALRSKHAPVRQYAAPGLATAGPAAVRAVAA